MLDEVMKAGIRPQADQLLQFETRSLRDTRQLLNTVSMADTLQFVEQNPHPRYRNADLMHHCAWGRDHSSVERHCHHLVCTPENSFYILPCAVACVFDYT